MARVTDGAPALGLDIDYQKLVVSQKQKNGELVVLKNNRIEKIKFNSLPK